MGPALRNLIMPQIKEGAASPQVGGHEHLAVVNYRIGNVLVVQGLPGDLPQDIARMCDHAGQGVTTKERDAGLAL